VTEIITKVTEFKANGDKIMRIKQEVEIKESSESDTKKKDEGAK
jgi:hypothetical protein